MLVPVNSLQGHRTEESIRKVAAEAETDEPKAVQASDSSPPGVGSQRVAASGSGSGGAGRAGDVAASDGDPDVGQTIPRTPPYSWR